MLKSVNFLSHHLRIGSVSRDVTGVAAQRVNGTTLHRWMGLGLAKGNIDVLFSELQRSTSLLRRWKETDVLVIDEVSMLSKELFEKVDSLARLVRGKKESPFGGMQLVVCGDFLQLPPVNGDFAFKAEALWAACNFQGVQLTEVRATSHTALKACNS